MPVDPRELKPTRGRLFELIAEDRLCPQCRYSLKGLPVGGRCPECGRPISSRGGRGRRFTDNLADAPKFYLKTLAIGLFIMAFFSIVSAFAFFIAMETLNLPAAIVAVGASVGWWVGVFITTGQRAFGTATLRDELLDSAWLRVANRAIQAAWVVSALLLVLAIRLPPAATHLATASDIFRIVAFLGLAPLAVQLSSLANWANDSGLSERLKVAAWAIAFFGIIVNATRLAATLGVAVHGLVLIAVLFASLLMAIAELVFLISLLQLAWIALWAIQNSRTAAEVDVRLMENKLRHEREMAERTARAVALNTPPPPRRKPAPGVPPARPAAAKKPHPTGDDGLS